MLQAKLPVLVEQPHLQMLTISEINDINSDVVLNIH